MKKHKKTPAQQFMERLTGVESYELPQLVRGRGFRQGRVGKHALGHMTFRQRVLRERAKRFVRNPADERSTVFRRVNWSDEYLARGLEPPRELLTQAAPIA